MMECDWVGGGSLAMKHGAAVTRTCKRVGAVDGDQDWSQETWIPSLLGNRSTNPLAITDIHAYRPAKKAIGTSPCGPVVKNLPSNAGDTGSIPCRGTKIPHATGQLSLRATMETQHSQKNPNCWPQVSSSRTFFQPLALITLSLTHCTFCCCLFSKLYPTL